MDADGGMVQVWNTGGDLEGICYADPESEFIYLGVEQPDGVYDMMDLLGLR